MWLQADFNPTIPVLVVNLTFKERHVGIKIRKYYKNSYGIY